MTLKKLYFLLLLLPLFSFTVLHEYYVSITQIDYSEKTKNLQITTRLFEDDLELALRKHYGDTLRLSKHQEKVDKHLANYLKRFFQVTINGEVVNLNFLGKEYDTGIALCYLEVENVSDIKSIEVSNTILFDIYENQENIIRTNINSKLKTFVLNANNTVKGVKF